MAVRNDPQQLGPLFVLVVVMAGALGYGWLQLGEAGRLAVLAQVARAEGPELAGRIPRDSMALQVGWLARHRGAQLEGMARLFLLCTVLGMVEGSRKRDATPLAGFGLGLFTLGRVVLALSGVGVLAYTVVPVVMPFAAVACVLSAGLGAASYLLMRGMPRVS